MEVEAEECRRPRPSVKGRELADWDYATWTEDRKLTVAAIFGKGSCGFAVGL